MTNYVLLQNTGIIENFILGVVMNGKYKSKVLAGLLSLFMVLGVIFSPLAFAKEEGKTQTYGNIDIDVPRNGNDAKEDAKPRQFVYFKVSDKEYTNEELEALYKKVDAMKMEDVVREYGEGIESEPSKVKASDDGVSYDSFELRGLEPGTYVLKETEESASNHQYKMVPIAWCSQEGVTEISYVKDKVREDNKPLILNKVGLTVDEKGNKTEEKLSGVVFNLIDIDKEGEKDSIVKLVKDKDGIYSYIKDSEDATTELETNEDGQIIINDLPEGNYKFKEIKTDEDKGYKIFEGKEYSKDLNFIPSNGANITVTNEKEEKNTLHLKKIDGTDPKITLAGVEFELYAASGNDLFPVGVDKDGKYLISDGKNTEGKDLNFIFKTDENGSIILTDLPQAPKGYRYEFREVKTLDDYVLVSDRTYPAEFGKAITVENYKDEFIEITLTKKDQLTNDELDKVGFELYRTKINKNKDGTARKERELVGLVGSTGSYQFDSNAGESNLIYQLYTNEKGEIKVTGLPDGDYYFKENKPLKDYDSAENRGKENARPFSRKLSKQTLTNKPKDVVPPDGNRKKKGGYKFIKIDDSKEKNRLANAVFAVFIENDKGEYIPYVVNEKGQYAPDDKDAKRLTLKSASNGEFEVQNLPLGKYMLRETAAPNGYILDVNPIKFEITSNSYEKDAIMIVNKKDTKKTVVPPTVTPPGKTNTPGTTPPSTTVKPPTTYYVPGNKTRIPRGPLVKTGDIRIVILVALGIVMIVAGSIIVNKDEKNQKIQLA